MNKFSFFALAIAGLLFAACSFDKDVAVEDQPQGEVPSEGYVSLAINLPTTPQVRAANDDFDDGLADEYAVKSCALLIYQGTSESDATLLSSTQYSERDLSNKKDDVDKDNITTSYLLTTTVSGVQAGKKLYALAFLNYSGILTFNTTTPTLSGTDVTNLSAVRDVTINNNSLHDASNGFFMANAVLSTTPGGITDNPITQKDSEGKDSKVFQYAELDPTKIFDTKEKAEREPAGEILVERAVAKATMSVILPETGGIVNQTNCTVDNITWVIDNTEPATYVVRNPGDNSYIGYTSDYFASRGNYRFVGNVSTKNATHYGTGKNYYRTYWCIDPQYSEKDAEGMLPTNPNYSSAFKPLYKSATEQNAQYCYENTFDVAHQSYKNTTRAIIKVQLTDNNTKFYTVNGGTTRYTQLSDASSYVLQFIMNHTSVVDAFQKNLKEGKSLDIDATYFTVTTEDDEGSAPAGQVKITKIEPSDKLSNLIGTNGEDKIFNAGLTDALETALGSGESGAIKEANDNFAILKYVGGVMYYEARFQHFAGMGDSDLAPWATWETDYKPTSGNSIANAYPESDKRDHRYLGRYGMVRNNWYDVTVTSFNTYGYPTVPSVTVSNPGYDGPDTPDDKLEDNIAVKIHVLAWAKRTQSWGF